VRDAVLAAEEDRAQVHVLHPLPRLQRGVEDGDVVVGADARVVEEDVQLPEGLLGERDHRLAVARRGDVGGERRRPLHRVGDLAHVDGDDPRAFADELDARLPADAAARAGDQRDLPVQATHQILSK
jgi:hypothetical protein